MPNPFACRLAARRRVAIALALALTGLAALPVQATPGILQATPVTTPLVIPDPQPVATAPPAPRTAPRPVADPPGSESLWFVGVFQ